MTAATTSPPTSAPSHEPMMLDWLLPEFDATLVEHRVIDADRPRSTARWRPSTWSRSRRPSPPSAASSPRAARPSG